MIDYYQIARDASGNIGNHPGLIYLKKICANSKKILDIGCGEGTRINTLLGTDKAGTGIDINSAAISRAKKQYPHHKFSVASAINIPFPGDSFDLVYSAFALEHVSDPEKFLLEMVRVCRKNGQMVILCPNFGAPNRRSPVSFQPPLKKLIKGFVCDFKNLSVSSWSHVLPKRSYENIDDDTTVEPYLLSLRNWFKINNCSIIESSSLWVLESWSPNMRKLLFKLLGTIGVFPFSFWGPQVFLVAKKI